MEEFALDVYPCPCNQCARWEATAEVLRRWLLVEMGECEDDRTIATLKACWAALGPENRRLFPEKPVALPEKPG